MELQAALYCLHVYSPDPAQAAAFYSTAFGMQHMLQGSGYLCSAPGRRLQLSVGPANHMKFAHFTLHTSDAWVKFYDRVSGLQHADLPAEFASAPKAVALKDPDDNLLVFTPAITDSASTSATHLPSAALQHFALRTAALESMQDFYCDSLGFVLSDAVRHTDGSLRACFVRTENLHHVLALFHAKEKSFDHQSFEAPDWASMKTWGDHMAAERVPIVWGIGRHGPGNDVFFMVRDPDGNLAEISSEIEHCATGRLAGLWPHEERTLNIWGKAILRS